MNVRPMSAEDLEALSHVTRAAFGNHSEVPANEMFGGLEIERFFGAYEGDELVGALGAYSFDMRVPDGVLPVAGTTVAVVLPTHRRRGILTSLMTHHFSEALGRGEKAAALWASETGIYGRFGYGRAFDRLEVEIDQEATVLDSAGTKGVVRFVEGDDKRLRQIWELIHGSRPGTDARNESWWQHEVIYDPPSEREGYSPFRFAIVEIDGRPGGYVKYRSKLDVPSNFRLVGELQVHELHASTDECEAALWRFLVEHDLVIKVHAHNLATDSIVDSVLVNHRQAHRRLVEGGWFRLLDVPAALTARGYQSDGSVSLAIVDEQVADNQGTWQLTITDGRATCEPVTNATPDLALSVAELGAAYFGAQRWRGLAAAGLVEGDDGPVGLADQMFGGAAAPWFDFF
jgi:predicted acetyltransferase